MEKNPHEPWVIVLYRTPVLVKESYSSELVKEQNDRTCSVHILLQYRLSNVSLLCSLGGPDWQGRLACP